MLIDCTCFSAAQQICGSWWTQRTFWKCWIL